VVKSAGAAHSRTVASGVSENHEIVFLQALQLFSVDFITIALCIRAMMFLVFPLPHEFELHLFVSLVLTCSPNIRCGIDRDTFYHVNFNSYVTSNVCTASSEIDQYRLTVAYRTVYIGLIH
jgi:hypothetical protein